MYKEINGQEILCCDICGKPLVFGDEYDCTGLVQFINRPAVQRATFSFCGECYKTTSLYHYSKEEHTCSE